MGDAIASLPSLWLMTAVFVIVVAASAIQVGLGMGFGLMAAPVLVLIYPSLVPAPILWIGLATSAIVAWPNRALIRWPEVGIAACGRAAGVVAGVAILGAVSGTRAFSLVFGLLVGFAVLLSLIGWRPVFNRVSLAVMGAVSGTMGTITSVGAPPMAIVYKDRPASEARPDLGAFFAIGSALSLVGLYASGFAGLHDVALAATLLPPMLVGAVIARKMRAGFDRRFRPLLLCISGGAAILLVLDGLR